MKFILQVIAVLLISWLLQSFLPWWLMAVGAFVIGVLFRQSGLMSFLAGLLGVGLLWFAMAYISSGGSDLAERVAAILPTKTVGVLLIVTALIGGLVGGFASMTGGLITYKKKARY
ncbi:MAG: hypothetical protein WDO15_10310 [Bacteroidota bacterium]